MDKATAIIISKKYIELVKAKFEIKQSMLFGSFAKGSFNNDSDIDVAIILKNTTDVIDAQIEMMKLRRSIDLRIEPHPFLQNDFNSFNPVANEVIKFGIIL
jgi:predicted nucleotidyltransferase